MARPVIDDEIAVKWCDNFIKDLDPQKYYFLKADVEEFKKDAKSLDDQIREGNIDFARKVFARFLQRSDERFKSSMELLKQKFDFTSGRVPDRRRREDRLSRGQGRGRCPLAEESQAGSPDQQGRRRPERRRSRSQVGRSATKIATDSGTRRILTSCSRSISPA